VSADVRLDLAIGEHERGRPLSDGRVAVPGFDLRVHTLGDDRERHDRFLAGDFDASEFSLALTVNRAGVDKDAIAIPVFPNRRFRHSFIYVNTSAGINEPKDLEGKRIGGAAWDNTAGVWARGMLADDHDVELASIRWTLRGRPDDEVLDRMGDRLTFTTFEPSTSPVQSLLEGTLDAIIVPSVIGPIRSHDPRVARLFPDYKSVEQDYYRRTGVLPISHAVVVRQEYLERNPEALVRLYGAWNEAKSLCDEYASHVAHSNLLWFGTAQEEEEEFFGRDPWQFTIDANRSALETFARYAVDQGIVGPGFDIFSIFGDIGASSQSSAAFAASGHT
jgi:4,5-dihydroxyphthalate decarboxylase